MPSESAPQSSHPHAAGKPASGRPASTGGRPGGAGGRPGGPGGPAPVEKPNLSEKGSPKDGQPQEMNRRLFVQLLAFSDCEDTAAVAAAMEAAGVEGVVYENIHDPFGIAVLAMHEDPNFFVGDWRELLQTEPLASLTPCPELTMFGRTYSIGYEPDLEETLFTRPRRTAMNADWPWVVWYPLRRKGEFEMLPPETQRGVLMEHGTIGRAFGESDLAHDIRLACHGMDLNDNDFVVGLMGKELQPLSAVVQTMRKTKQTSQYLDRLGPFFVGKVAWQSRFSK